MGAEQWVQLVQQGGIAAIVAAFLTGLVFSFNPVALASVPVALAYVTRARETRQAALYGAMFVVGMLVTHVVLGFLAGLGGQWVQGLLGRFWGLALGPILILLGLVWTGWVRLPLPAFALRARRPQGMWGAFSLGVPFSIAVCPACTPALVVLLGVATTLGSALTGALLLLAFALGRAVPVALGSFAVGWLEGLRGLASYRRAFEILGGVTLVAAGLYMLNAYFFWIPELAA
jgi:cytochrome c-type biogenesis protein